MISSYNNWIYIIGNKISSYYMDMKCLTFKIKHHPEQIVSSDKFSYF